MSASTSGLQLIQPCRYIACPQSYLDYVNSLPLIAAPEVFGLHDNADITKDLQETSALLEGLLSTQGRSGATSAPATAAAPAKGAAAGPGAAAAAVVKGPEAVIAEVAGDILGRLPANFDIEATEAAYPQDYFNSMNTVLVQVRDRPRWWRASVCMQDSCTSCLVAAARQHSTAGCLA